jgi:hypothetical protein
MGCEDFLDFGKASAKAQVPKDPVTEPKRSQNPKRPQPGGHKPSTADLMEIL